MSKLRASQVLNWEAEAPSGVTLQNIYLGADPIGLGPCEIAVCDVSSAPSRETLRDLYKKRKGNRSVTCLLVLAIKDDRAWIFGPDEQTQVIDSLSAAQATRLVQSALDEASSLQAYTRLVANRRALETSGISGFTNNGLFASYHIRTNATKRSDWAKQTELSEVIRDLRHQELINALGFTTKSTVGNALVLSSSEEGPRAVAVLLDETEHFDAKSSKYQLSPVAWGLNVAAKQGVPWLIVLRKDQIRLYPGKDGVGVGNKGQVETYFEVNLTEIDDEHVGLLSLVFSAAALAQGGTADELLKESQKYAADLGNKLRERIYEHVVPAIAISVSEQLPTLGLNKDSEGLSTAYRLSLRILFRILFQAYGEDRGLLPAGRSEKYDANSLKTIATRIQDQDPATFGDSASIWKDLTQVWDVIDKGADDWFVPAYNGGLFGTDPEFHPEGALIERIRIPDSVLGPALQHFIVDVTEDGVLGPVDFRSLSVREFGTIYEGLLESSLSVTEIDLAVDKNGAWVPAVEGAPVDAPANSVYFHSASGERKATGSYFTPSFVVDHLIDRSLDPALDKHLEKIKAHLEAGDDGAAARDFFDFRVADLAMGSGHFLVAAVDRIESKMRSFLAEPGNNVPGVTEELLRLADAAKEALGKDEVAIGEIEPIGLLRRQVARRCIYGLDINPLAVELTRLALWIHTFVPGLPMSSLDHGLVCANSLTGIGTIDEALDALQPRRLPGQATFIDAAIEENLSKAKTLLVEVANASESSKKEVQDGAKKAAIARAEAEPTKRLLDLAVAARLGKISVDDAFDVEEFSNRALEKVVAETASIINPAHMIYLFPEVFLKDQSGFDVLIGNPPWEKIKIEEDVWWGQHLPKFRGMSRQLKTELLNSVKIERPDLVERYDNEIIQVADLRKAVSVGPYKELGSAGDPDLYQAFCWRNWQLVNDGGYVALVLPRTALSGSGLAKWRKTILSEGSFESTVFATNTNHWVFESIDARYSVCFVSLHKGDLNQVKFGGPYTSRDEFEEKSSDLVICEATDFMSWSSSALFPLLNSQEALNVFRKMNDSPRFSDLNGGAKFRPTYELHSSANKNLFTFDVEEQRNRIPVWGGSNYNIWEPSTGNPKAYSEPELLRPFLHDKYNKALKSANSAYFGTRLPDGKIPMDFPRISFRMVTNQTNTRTAICCLIPPNVTTEHSAQLVVIQEGGNAAEAFLIGVMSSIPFDWMARRWVELNLTFEILNNLPVPAFSPDSEVIRNIIKISTRLASPDNRYEAWAKSLGESVGFYKSASEIEDAICELDALVAIAYRLSASDLETIYSTFHRGWDYLPRLNAVLEHFEAWSRKV